MKFKTTIKIVSEARDKNEAMEIAGEYLSGNLATGIDMQLRTNPVHSNNARAGIVLAVLFVFGVAVAHLSHVKPPQNFISYLPGDSVVQPPLKTSQPDKKAADFKTEWQAKHSQEVLNSLRK